MPPPTYGVAFPWSKRQPASAVIGTRLMVSGAPETDYFAIDDQHSLARLRVAIDRSAEEETTDPPPVPVIAWKLFWAANRV